MNFQIYQHIETNLIVDINDYNELLFESSFEK
jgi:hypothetical protein